MNDPLGVKQKKVVPTPEVRIDKLSHEGRGIVYVDGRTVFIDGVLLGETVRFRYCKRNRKQAQGVVTEVIEASPQRVEARCAHFLTCGGCSLQHISPARQIALKQAALAQQLQHIAVAPQAWLSPITGSAWGYRYKARLSVKYVPAKGGVLVGFREKQGRYVADIQRCDVLHPSVGLKIDQLRALVARLSVYANVPQIDVAAGDSEVALVIRHLVPLTEADKAELKAFSQQHGLQVFVQPGGANTVTRLAPEKPGEPLLSYALPEQELQFQFHPSDFTQINPEVNQAMVVSALDLLALEATDRVLELFCGLGNFSLSLAKQCAALEAVEGEQAMVARAAENARQNGISNVNFHACDLTKPMEATWAQARYDKLLLDPPRSGAFAVLPFIQHWQPRRIVYVSCNVATLVRDTQFLVENLGYRLSKIGVLDMFPHTQQVESIALFDRNS